MKYRTIIIVSIIVATALIITLGWSPISAATRQVVNLLKTYGGLNDGLVGYWSFDGPDVSGTTATDRGSGGNNGTLTNGPIVASGVVGQAIKFDGSNDEVNLGTAHTAGITDITISAWVKLGRKHGANGTNYHVFGNETFQQDGYVMRVEDDTSEATSGKISFRTSQAAAAQSVVSVAGTFPNDLSWHHFVATKSGTVGNVYIDGVAATLDANQAMTNPTNSTSNTAIGASRGGANSQNFLGLIDEVRVYNRALSAAEVAYLYNRTAPTERSKQNVNQNNRFGDGLVGFWPFNGPDVSGTTATDRSVSGLNGTIGGTPQRRSGVVGQALDFDGVDNTVTISNNAAINPASISVGFWMFANREVAFQSPLSKTTSSAWNDGYGFYNRSSNSTLEWFVDKYSGGAPAGGYVVATMPSVGQWHHVIGTYDGATVTLYIDGAVSGTPLAYATGITHSATDLVIGNIPGGAVWDGVIDEVRIYNRALSATEVAALYRSGAPTERSKQNVNQNNRFTDGLVGFWPFNGPDVSGTTATDRGGGGNNGTLTNGPTVASGIVGQALSFDGINDGVLITDADSLDLAGDMTVSMWVKNNSTNTKAFLSKTTGTGGVYLGYVSGFVFGAYNVANTPISTPASSDVGVWHHLVGVFTSATNNRDLYIDGVLVGSSATGAGNNTWSNLANVYIGAGLSGTNLLADAQIDESRVYNRALSATEVAEIYRAGKRE